MLRISYREKIEKIENLIKTKNPKKIIEEYNVANTDEERFHILFSAIYYLDINFNKNIYKEINLKSEDYEYLLSHIFEKGLSVNYSPQIKQV